MLIFIAACCVLDYFHASMSYVDNKVNLFYQNSDGHCVDMLYR